MDIIYKQEFDRWIKGDRYIRPLVRKIFRPHKLYYSGMEMVVRNFLIGLRTKKISFSYNRYGLLIGKNKPVISFGMGINGVSGLSKTTPIICAIGFPYPGELPELCNDYNVKKYLQHSDWVLNLAKSSNIYSNDIFDLWPAGIDVKKWIPNSSISNKEIDVLIYNKIYWDIEKFDFEIIVPIKKFLTDNNYTFSEIKYGRYTENEYKEKLRKAKIMIFLSPSETQGLAYQECLSSGVPILAWDQGYWLDPLRFNYNKPVVQATSVPYFDQRCGMKFKNIDEFYLIFDEFYNTAISNEYKPRDFINENLTIEKSTEKMLKIYKSIS